MNTSLGDTTVAAVRDAGIPWLGANHGVPWRDLELTPSEPYFNSGVLVIDVERWASADIAKRCLDLMTKFEFYHGDQGALNAVLHDDWTVLPVAWNVQTGHFYEHTLAWVTEPPAELAAALADPNIVHFSSSPRFGGTRPWTPGCTHPRLDDWFAMLDRTAWSQWRPVRTPPTVFERARGKLRRAVRELRRG